MAYLMEMQKEKDKAIARKEKFFSSVDQKKLQALVEVKRHGRVRSAKALHFTNNASLDKAEAWINEHAGDDGIDVLEESFLDSFSGVAAAGDAMDVTEAEPEPEEERKVGDPNPQEIKDQVNKSMLEELLAMGFPEIRAEKALFTVDNASVVHAVEWLGTHGEDADIDLPLRRPKPAAPPAPEKPKLSKEEAEAKAMELQKKLRQKKAEEEKLSDKEKERMRIESVKMMHEANEKLKEEEKARAYEQLRREKEQQERDRAVLKEKLRQDYIERFGCEPPPEEEVLKDAVKEKSGKDQVIYYLNRMKKEYKDTNPEGLKTCLNTLKVYIKNLQENPTDPKYKKLKLENKAFQSRIVPFSGAFEILDVLGFEKKEDCLEQRKSIADGWLCGQAIKFIDLISGQI